MWMGRVNTLQKGGQTTKSAQPPQDVATTVVVVVSRGPIATKITSQKANITTQPTLPWARDDNGPKKPRTGGRGTINPEDFKDLMKPLEKVAINKSNFKFQKPPTVVPFISLKNFQKKPENIVVPQQDAEKSKLRQQQLNLLADKLGQKPTAGGEGGGVAAAGGGDPTKQIQAANQEQITEILKELEMVKLKYQEGLRRKLERDSMESRMVYDNSRGLGRSHHSQLDGQRGGMDKFDEEAFSTEGYEEGEVDEDEDRIRDPYWDMLFAAAVSSDPYILVPYLTDPNILHYRDEDLKRLLAKFYKKYSKAGKDETLHELQEKQRVEEGIDLPHHLRDDDSSSSSSGSSGGSDNIEDRSFILEDDTQRSRSSANLSSVASFGGKAGNNSAAARVLQLSQGIAKDLEYLATQKSFIQFKRPYEAAYKQSGLDSKSNELIVSLPEENGIPVTAGEVCTLYRQMNHLHHHSLWSKLEDSEKYQLSELIKTINTFDTRQFVLHSGIQPYLLNAAEQDMTQEELEEEGDDEKREVFDAQFLFKALVRDFDVYKARRVPPSFREFCKRKQKERKLIRRKKFHLLRRDLKVNGFVSRDAYIATASEIISKNFGEENASIPSPFLPFFEEITTAIALNPSYTWTKKVDSIVEFVLSANAYMRRHPTFDNDRMLAREREQFRRNLDTWVDHHSRLEEFQIHFEKTGMFQEFEPAYASLYDLTPLEEEVANEGDDTVEYEGNF